MRIPLLTLWFSQQCEPKKRKAAKLAEAGETEVRVKTKKQFTGDDEDFGYCAKYNVAMPKKRRTKMLTEQVCPYATPTREGS